MRKIMNARKGGFTLVELLIVIIIIAILAGMMLLTTGAATDGAEASKLVNNLRALKSAALLHYVDNGMQWIAAGTDAQDIIDELSPYMDRSVEITKYDPWIISGDTDEIRVLIGFTANSGIFAQKPGVKAKLANMAESSGLYTGSTGSIVPYTGSGPVYMYLR